MQLSERDLETKNATVAARAKALEAIVARWRPVQYHGHALACMGLKEWEAALGSIDKAIDAQSLRYFEGRRSENPTDWQKEAATVKVARPDDIRVELWAWLPLVMTWRMRMSLVFN